MNLFTFGTIFTYLGDAYVYLASSGRVTYAAKIVARKDAHFVDRYLRVARQGTPAEQAALRDNRLYYYVELKTDGHEGEIAHLDRTDEQRDESRFNLTDETLCREDLLALKKEIEDAPLPRGLKKRVKDIEV